MARYTNDPFPGTDYSKYLEWPKVVLPSGEIFYEVPGHPGYVYDPVASNASGRKVFRPNPKGQISDQEKQKKQQDDLIKQQKQASSPAGQLLPVVASTGGLIAASHLMQPAAPSIIIGGQGAQAVAPAVAPAVVPTTQGVAAAQGVQGGSAAVSGAVPAGTSGAVPVGTAANGGTLMSDGTIAPAASNGGIISSLSAPSGTLGQVGGSVAAAKGLYDTADAWQHGGSGRAGLTELGAGIGMIGSPLGSLVGAGMGNLAGYGLQGNGIMNHIALGINPLTLPLEIARLGGFNVIHKTTRQVAQEHSADLANQHKDDKQYQDYVKAMRTQYNAAPPDPSKPFAGKYKTWEEYKKAGLESGDLTGVYGNIKAYGDEWAHLTQEQRDAITKANIDSGIYDSKKGEVIITDEKIAQENKKKVLAGFGITTTPTTTTKPPTVTPPVTTVKPAGSPNAQAAAQGAGISPVVLTASKKTMRNGRIV